MKHTFNDRCRNCLQAVSTKATAGSIKLWQALQQQFLYVSNMHHQQQKHEQAADDEEAHDLQILSTPVVPFLGS